MLYRCSCGNISKIRFFNFRRGERCLECSGSKKYTIEEAKQYFKEQGCELLENQYRDGKTKMKYKCKCGRISYIRHNNFIRGGRCRKCADDALTGPNNPRYNHNLTIQDRQTMRQALPEYKEWRKIVYKRDYWTCQRCHQKGLRINAHHIKNYISFPEGRIDPNNGITLCKNCHISFHSKYGNKNNNEQQLKEYLGQPKSRVGI